jgi:hypothetical protein
VAGFCEDGNEPLSSIRRQEFPDHLTVNSLNFEEM